MAAKIYVADIETAPMIVRTWSVWNANIQPINVIQDRSIICIAWRELGGKRTYSSCVSATKTERQVVAEFRAAVDDADILIGHSFANFDIRHITAKLIQYDLDPFQKLHIIDTLREIKKVAKFTFARLDYLCQQLLGKRKLETDMQLWIDCMAGDQKALAKMERYCKHDVEITEAFYLKVRPYFRNHPNVADSDSMSCPRCNSDVATLRKAYRTKTGLERAHFNCVACRAPFTIAATKVNRPLSAV